MKTAIEQARPQSPTREPRPDTGARFVEIPESQGIGTQVGQTMAGTLTGTSVDQAPKSAQAATERTTVQAGNPKT